MNLIDSMSRLGHEQVVFFHHADSGLRCVIAIHSTVLGPALGGLRMWPYTSESDAVRDALRHARDMTYKSAIAGLDFGGAKGILLGNPETDKSEASLRALGRFIDSLGGRYIAAEDVGTTADDMDYIRSETPYVAGAVLESGANVEAARSTALGTLHGIRACLEFKYGHAQISRVSFAIQGAGQVGYHLAKLLREHGAKVFITDIAEDRVEQVVNDCGAEPVPMSQIYDVDADVFSPCALGAVINEETLPRLRCEIVAGGANNQLESEELGTELQRRGVLYAPDYAINAGGLIRSALELQEYSETRIERHIARIHDVLTRIFALASREKIPTWQAARRLAEERLRSIGRTKLL